MSAQNSVPAYYFQSKTNADHCWGSVTTDKTRRPEIFDTIKIFVMSSHKLQDGITQENLKMPKIVVWTSWNPTLTRLVVQVEYLLSKQQCQECQMDHLVKKPQVNPSEQ